ncbi:MAG: hypothetical protein HY051_00040 [Candidatus Aenigmarchaeota archaeon]|nr:hypothetical protein [Candidatus Aenigmarchaeota archaeon]
MDIPKIKSLIGASDKAAELKSENYFLSSVMFILRSLSSPAHTATVNFYNKTRNELASFSLRENSLEFAGLSPPMKETEIMPLEIERTRLEADDIMKKCGGKTDENSISRIVLVLRTSTNSKTENGPTWQASIFLKNFQVVSVIFDAENGEEIASTKFNLSANL